MGLVISENIVKAFAGIIGVKSKWRKGTKFAFSIVLGKHADYQDNMNNQGELRPASQEKIESISDNSQKNFHV